MPEREKKLVVCFCPHGFSTATSGHFHCRYCGHSSRLIQMVIRHEKIHRNFMLDEVVTSEQRYCMYSCRQCGFRSRYVKNLLLHEKREHMKSRPVTNKHVQSRRQPTAIGTGVRLEITANRLRVSIRFTLLLMCMLLGNWQGRSSMKRARNTVDCIEAIMLLW